MLKIDYQQKLTEILKEIEQFNRVPSLLIHACCAPCSSYVIQYLSNHFDITLYYYNPNIFPHDEYSRRLNELKTFLQELPTKNPIKFIEKSYQPDDYYNVINELSHLGERSKRCYECYKLRMEHAAYVAKENDFDFFTTTLSISPHKVSNWINEIGDNLQTEYSIRYLFADFKKNNGYLKSLELSQEYNLYRQDYCGCEFSKEKK